MAPLTLTIDRDYCRFGSLPPWLIKELSARLSYLSPKASEYNTAYTTGRWDGYSRLFDSSRLSFPTGLLMRVLRILKEHNVEYVISKKILPPLSSSDGVCYTPKHNLYEYQLEAVNAAIKHKRGVISIPTGGGKTEVAQHIIHTIGCERIAFFVPGISLLDQSCRRFKEAFPDTEVIKWGDGSKPPDVPPKNYILVATVASALKRPSAYLSNAQMVFVDESHHQAADTYIKAVKLTTNAYYYFGLSATAYRHDGKDLELEAWLGPIIYKITYKELIDNGFLTPPEFHCVRSLEEGLDLIKPLRTIIFSEKLEDLKRVKPMFDTHNIPIITGNTPSKQRLALISSLENKEVNALACTPIFDEGVDMPTVDGAFMWACCGSRVKAIQRVGRAMRKAPGKDRCVIVDYKDAKYPDRLAAYLKEPAFAERIVK